MSAAPEPCAAPPPDPGRLLLAAQLLSIGEPASFAAARAGLDPAHLAALRADPASPFAALLADAALRRALGPVPGRGGRLAHARRPRGHARPRGVDHPRPRRPGAAGRHPP